MTEAFDLDFNNINSSSTEVDGIEILVMLAKQGKIDPWNIDIIDVTDKYLTHLFQSKSKNLRLTADASIGMQKLPEESTRNKWGKAGHDETEIRTALTLAPVITLNNDFYGRPQIKPFVTFGNTNDDKVNLYDGEQSGTFFGVVAEVWF